MEWEREKKKKKKKKKKGKEGRRDPLEVLGTDLMLRILMKLDARSVALSSLISRRWHLVAFSDPLCARHCGPAKPIHPECHKWMGARGILWVLGAYSFFTLVVSQTRITKYDLSDHAWEFHLSKAAPEYWRNLDPYWKRTGRLMHRYFHLDGSQSADPGDNVWGGHKCCYCTVTSSLEDGKVREHHVRINRCPLLCVSRKQDWSWEMKNHLCCYSTIPDAVKPVETGPLFPVM